MSGVAKRVDAVVPVVRIRTGTDEEVRRATEIVVVETNLTVHLVGDMDDTITLFASPIDPKPLIAGALFRKFGLLPLQWRIASVDRVENNATTSAVDEVTVKVTGARGVTQRDPGASSGGRSFSASFALPASITEIATVVARLDDSSVLRTRTGGVHVISYVAGTFSVSSEDISRHSAVDRLVGSLLLRGTFPWPGIIALSCRITRDILSRAVALNIPVCGSVSAPTADAVDSARWRGVTLCGFVRAQRMTVYAGSVDVDGKPTERI